MANSKTDGKTETGVALPAPPEYPIMVAAGDVAENLRENVGTNLTVFDLDRVKIPTGGGTHWSVPTLSGKNKALEELIGIIVAWRDPRAFWEKSLDETGGGIPPDCSSNDGVLGVGDPGGQCAKCRYAQFGSAPAKPGSTELHGRGQACKQMRLIFLVQPGELLPVAIFLPPTSLAATRKYFLRLASQGYRYSDVITSLALELDKNAGGIEYAFAVPSTQRVLDAEERTAVRAYSAAITGAIASVDLRADDVTDSGSGGLDDGA